MKKIKVLHMIIFIIGSAFILSSIFHTNLWFDETYSVAISKHSIKEIWEIGGYDVHPVLYYWMLRIVNLVCGNSIIFYRIFSGIGIILLGLIGFTHIRKDFGEKTGLFFTFITFFMPVSSIYANQIRMYSWAILILTLFFIYAYRIYNKKENFKNWVLLALFSLCSIYIHYYGLIAVGITLCFLLANLIKNKRNNTIKKIITILIIDLLLYLPWIIYLIKQIEHIYSGFWIGINSEEIIKIIGCNFIGKLNIYFGLTISIIMDIYIIIFIYKNKNKLDISPIKISSIIYLSVIISAIIISILLKTSIVYHRYLFVITGLYIFVLSYILANDNKKFFVYIICFIIFTLGIINIIYQLEENYNKENTEVINFLKENVQKDDDIVYSDIENAMQIIMELKNKQFFYNKKDWNVKKAYKVYNKIIFYEDIKFTEDLNKRILLIDSNDESLYKELFKNNNYEVIENRYFKTTYYEDYYYNIKLLQKN